MGSSNSTSETSENNESDTVEKISEVVGRAIGAAIGDKVAGVPGTIVGEEVGKEVGKHVITPAIKYMGENGAYSYDTPNGTVVGNAYGSTLYYDDGTVADVELYLD